MYCLLHFSFISHRIRLPDVKDVEAMNYFLHTQQAKYFIEIWTAFEQMMVRTNVRSMTISE